jgi:hypothetical protein
MAKTGHFRAGEAINMITRSNPLINQDNLTDIDLFMGHRLNVLQNDPSTVRCRRHELNHVLIWAGDIPFPGLPVISSQ